MYSLVTEAVIIPVSSVEDTDYAADADILY